jgi:hypothetical protein
VTACKQGYNAEVTAAGSLEEKRWRGVGVYLVTA